MRRLPLFLAATLLVGTSLNARAQTSIEAPAGWTTQTKTSGAQTFTPPDLAAGEIYSVTIYDSAALKGQTLPEYLRKFAGPVGAKTGQLMAPLKIQTSGLFAAGGGVYRGPNGKELGVAFTGDAPDSRHIYVSRILFSSAAVLERYQKISGEIASSRIALARREAGENVVRVPERVGEKLKPGGDLVPGIYEGKQFWDEEIKYRLRLYIYPSGEFQFKSDGDSEFRDRWGSTSGVGEVAYNRNTGQMSLGNDFGMTNDGSDQNAQFCYYGRDSAGKPAIFSRKTDYFRTQSTFLILTKSLAPSASPSEIKARKDAKIAKDAAIQAEKDRFKWVTAPGKGVQTAQIQAVWLHSELQVDVGFGSSLSHDTYLLLKDGTIYRGLPVAPDEIDIVKSRANEPKNWGRWKRAGKGYQVSWAGAPYKALEGEATVPASANQKLNGYWGSSQGYNNFGSSFSRSWGITFAPGGRFQTGSSSVSSASFGLAGGGTVSRADDEGSESLTAGPNYSVGTSTSKKNPLANRQGTYSLSGYVLTLRYDNGKIERAPFFFLPSDKPKDAQKFLWYFGSMISRDHVK